MLQFYAKKSFNEDPQRVNEPPLERAWVYGAALTNDELDQVAAQYELNPGILKDVHDRNELPRVEYSEGSAYVFIRAPYEGARGNVAAVPVLAVLKGSLLITLSKGEYVKPTELFLQADIDMRSTKHVFLQLVSYVIGQFETFINNTGHYILNTEQRLRTHEVDTKDFIHFVTVEHDLTMYRTNLTAIDALLDHLHDNKHDIFSEKDCEFIEDLVLHCNQLLVETESHLSTVVSIRNTYTTISNNVLNQRMKTLTFLTLLIALPNVIFGMFSMNVPMPFAAQPWAYGAIVSVGALSVIAVLFIVRKIRF